MTELQTIYDDLFRESVDKIRNGEHSIDRKTASDDRFGLTLLLRPDVHTKAHISAFMEALKSVEPKQYFYPNTDLHVTILSVISAHSGFELEKIDVERYVAVIRKSLEKIEHFEIELKGVTVSPEAVLVQGFPPDETLENIRENLRNGFKNSDLHQTIDSRYKISTAHVTVARFTSELKNPAEFVEIISTYRSHCFGKFEVEKLEFVCNDWYQKKEKTTSLSVFELK